MKSEEEADIINEGKTDLIKRGEETDILNEERRRREQT